MHSTGPSVSSPFSTGGEGCDFRLWQAAWDYRIGLRWPPRTVSYGHSATHEGAHSHRPSPSDMLNCTHRPLFMHTPAQSCAHVICRHKHTRMHTHTRTHADLFWRDWAPLPWTAGGLLRADTEELGSRFYLVQRPGSFTTPGNKGTVTPHRSSPVHTPCSFTDPGGGVLPTHSPVQGAQSCQTDTKWRFHS